MDAVHIKTTGMMCNECTSLVKESVSQLGGVIGVISAQATDITSVMFDASQTSRDSIIEAVRHAGFGAEFVDVPQHSGV